MLHSFEHVIKNETAPYAIDIHEGSATLLVTFAGISGALGIFPFEFFNITKDFNINKIFIRDFNQSWYHSGISGISSDIEGTARFLQGIIKNKRYKKIVCLGNSMGGYAAIIIGTLINADIVHAFAPQTFLDNENRSRHKDNRWPEQIAQIPISTAESYLDLADFFEHYRNDCEINIHYPDDERIDIAHALHLKNHRNVVLHRYDQGGHQLVQHLKKSGELYRLLRNSLSDFSGDRIVSVFKEIEAGISIDEACKRHVVSAETYNEWHHEYGNSRALQTSLLLRFFATVEKHLSTNKFRCVNDKIDKAHLYNEEYCRGWFGDNKYRKQLFGSFFHFGNDRHLLHVEVGSKNLHLGIVKYAAHDGVYKIAAMTADECAALVSDYKPKLPEHLKLEARSWGHKWCSIDCGDFQDLSQHETFRAMFDFGNSRLLKEQFLPFLTVLSP